MADYHRDNAVFLVYKDWETLFDTLDSNEEAGELIRALFAFAKRGEMSEFSGALKMAFIFMSQQIERDGRKWEDTCNSRSEAGKKGGRPSKAKESKKTNCFSENQMQAKEADTDTDTDTDTVTDKDSYADKPPKQSRFRPPSYDEVEEYCRERQNGVDVQRFIDYYSSNGWKVGKNPMKDWKAAVRTWERNGYQNPVPKSEPQRYEPPKQNRPVRGRNENFANDSFDESDLDALFNANMV